MTDPVVSRKRPYLLRALHEWMTDNSLTPHLAVSADLPGVQVPRQFVEDGRIVLNVSYSATRGLVLGNDEVSFEARFSGTPFRVRVPMPAVLGIYARESGEGLVFALDEYEDGPSPDTPPPGPPSPGSGAPGSRESGSQEPGPQGPPDPPPTRPTLKIVK